MHQREYDRLKKQIEGEYRDKLRALDLVWKMAGKNSSAKPKGDPKEGSLASFVRQAVERIGGRFTLRDVVAGCEADSSTDVEIRLPSVSGILKRMADQGAIKVVEQGSGRRPTIYTKP
jgi:hypothetical protein